MKYFHVIFKWLAKGCSVRRILNTTRVGIFFGIFWYTIFTHFLAAGKNNARTLPQVVIERERAKEWGRTALLLCLCSTSSPALVLFPPSLSISLDGRRVHSSGRRRVHHQHRRGIFFSRSFVFAASAAAPVPPAPSPAPTLSALASQSSNQPHLKYLWLLFDWSGSSCLQRKCVWLNAEGQQHYGQSIPGRVHAWSLEPALKRQVDSS